MVQKYEGISHKYHFQIQVGNDLWSRCRDLINTITQPTQWQYVQLTNWIPGWRSCLRSRRRSWWGRLWIQWQGLLLQVPSKLTLCNLCILPINHMASYYSLPLAARLTALMRRQCAVNMDTASVPLTRFGLVWRSHTQLDFKKEGTLSWIKHDIYLSLARLEALHVDLGLVDNSIRQGLRRR